MQPPPVTVSVVEAEPITWTPGIEAIGTASALRGVDLGVEAGGIVQEIHFRANDRVEAGQPLVQIDDRMERADVEAAQARSTSAASTLTRVESLRERGVTSVSELDIARADATNAEAALVRLTAVMEQKALTAPFDGIIGIPQVEVGAYVQPGTVYATLQDVDTLRVDFSIPEQQIRLIEVGMPLTASTEVDGSTATGKIVAIEPRIDPNSRLVLVRGEIDTQGGHDQPRPVPARPRRAADRGRRDRPAADRALLDALRQLGLRGAEPAPRRGARARGRGARARPRPRASPRPKASPTSPPSPSSRSSSRPAAARRAWSRSSRG